MSEKSKELSKYIQLAHEVLDGNKTQLDLFTKDLLKIGLLDEDKDTLNDEFPSYTGADGNLHIAKGKGGDLRNYYHGKRGLSKLLPKLGTEFDEEFIDRYSEELQDYDDSKVVEFAHRLHLAEGTDDINKVSKAIAEHYSAIMKEEAPPKRRKSKESKDKPMTDVNSLERAYSFTDTEKKTLRNVLGAIVKELHELEHLTKTIDATQGKILEQTEINKPNDAEADEHSKDKAEYMRDYFVSAKLPLVKRFSETYSRIEKLCADMIELLEPKKDMNKAFSTLILIASNISIGKYKCMEPDEYNYMDFWIMISEFKRKIIDALRVVEKL